MQEKQQYYAKIYKLLKTVDVVCPAPLNIGEFSIIITIESIRYQRIAVIKEH